MVALDTSPEAAALQLQAYREMGPAGHLQIAFELSDLVHAMAVAGIRRHHPELSEADARTMLAERLYRSTSPMIGELLNRITTALEMHGIPYMLTGSVASSLYGVPRATIASPETS